MALIKINNLSFHYPQQRIASLDTINLQIEQGEFVVLCGTSGCGKSTLLKQLKRELTPHGEISGDILFNDIPLADLSPRQAASAIGYVLQNPENQIVTDQVWHELAFGLENLGVDSMTIRRRVAEMASFFGIQNWFRKNTMDLSGGQKQLLNLASIMVMQPELLILDEPTSQLDPIAASEFIAILHKLNKELGLTIVLVEHRLEEVYPLADRVIIMDQGRIIANDTPSKAAAALKQLSVHHPMLLGLPTSIRLHHTLGHNDEVPLTIRQGAQWLSQHYEAVDVLPIEVEKQPQEPFVINAEDVWFRYDKNGEDIVRGLQLQVAEGEFLSILGGNGTGKSTSLNLLSGLLKAHRGRIKLFGKALKTYRATELYNGLIALLPQDPTTLLVEKTVALEFQQMTNQTEDIKQVVELLQIEHLLTAHPYDLSGGEQQKVALGKVLLKKPKILLLDEPTKGLDGYSKKILAAILYDLQQHGTTIIMVTHDIEFSAAYCSRCAMFFDGQIVSEAEPVTFYSGNHFYTTAAHRMSRHLFTHTVTMEQIAALCNTQHHVGVHR
ncbi:ABC transporter ATP-binding protein [Kurthia sibirica]|uniref:Cobalt ABC transporter ATP-binding protein n=1 Tax=Kurthia sibirica TaxID=202750 RepID=A0A2U3AN31_9BACL|nr:ABC transporter ATP-binding protein [Kurthia sibirica]PWI25921.1 cobalt ABC transporter ATP-binding protein [Kurthia sibirica]GEK34277.1 hypothetical protein KSI01_18100 [Kurthia sibirica]